MNTILEEYEATGERERSRRAEYILGFAGLIGLVAGGALYSSFKRPAHRTAPAYQAVKCNDQGKCWDAQNQRFVERPK